MDTSSEGVAAGFPRKEQPRAPRPHGWRTAAPDEPRPSGPAPDPRSLCQGRAEAPGDASAALIRSEPRSGTGGRSSLQGIARRPRSGCPARNSGPASRQALISYARSLCDAGLPGARRRRGWRALHAGGPADVAVVRRHALRGAVRGARASAGLLPSGRSSELVPERPAGRSGANVAGSRGRPRCASRSARWHLPGAR
jgi:hypothetical protein